MWEKIDTADEKINGKLQVVPAGSGERQSKRLKERNDSTEETTQTIKPQTPKLSVTKKTSTEPKKA